MALSHVRRIALVVLRTGTSALTEVNMSNGKFGHVIGNAAALGAWRKKTGTAPPGGSFNRRQFTGTVTVPSEIHSQSPSRTELVPREHMVLRRDPPKPKRVVILDGYQGKPVDMPGPKPEPLVNVERAGGTVLL